VGPAFTRRGPGRPKALSEMEGLTYKQTDSAGPDGWDELNGRLETAQREADRLRAQLSDASVGLSSFESLFRISPFPIMEQDYTQLVRWMDELRSRGVTDIRETLHDAEAIRRVVPMVWISAANPAAARAVGLPVEELIGPIDPRIVNEESYNSWISQFEAVWRGEAEAHASFVAGTPDGVTYDAESTFAAPLVDGQPDYSRAMFTVVDVSEHRSEERRMEELIESKNKFLASISHEIRTPLTAIVGFSQVLEDDGQMSSEDRTALVTSIVQQAREMADLVEDLLVAARAESGQVKVSLTSVDIVQQVSQTLDAGGSFTVGVDFDRPEQPIRATADPARVRQILRNLLTNAERYGGPNVSVSASTSHGSIDIEVVDDGHGLPRDQWESIFHLYHRAHEGGRHESLGIGLAVSRQLAELMGGTLDYSRVDGESVFRLRLPAS
jgi:signal transduction histidine kinase